MSQLTIWVKQSDTLFAKVMRYTYFSLKHMQFPLIPIVHKALYFCHKSCLNLSAEIARFFYFTPLFKSQISGSKRRLYLYSGLPQILGNLKIRFGDDVRISGVSSLIGRSDPTIQPTLIVGNNVDIGWQNTIAVGRNVVIEDDVRLAGRVFLAGFPGHPVDSRERAMGLPDKPEQIGDIVLKKGCWIGTGATIIGGVTVGEGAIVAASSVVTHDVPANVMVAGNPAVIVKHLN